jgi:hypothetical protein
MPASRPKRLSWFFPPALWACRNDKLAWFADPVPLHRSRWLDGSAGQDFAVDLSDRLGDYSFLLLGDTGEGDESQFAVVPPLLSRAADTAFLVICSDVLYPLGDVNQYDGKFFLPYADYLGPIYALPGNHDWYDDLAAFMFHFCGRDRPPAQTSFADDVAAGSAAGWRVWLRRRLWRRPARELADQITAMRARRARPVQQQPVPQPGPYFTIDTRQLRLVCIDTGIVGDIDAEQGRWLERVSADPRPKILLTGKPLVVDGGVQPCRITGATGEFSRVLEIVHDPRFRYLASIGGDIHNYQRYPVRIGDRTVQHLVSGGGGAFMHATHLIVRIDPAAALGVTEEEFRCYPLRRDSLAAYSRVLQGMLGRLHVRVPVTLTPGEAAAVLAERMNLPSFPDRPVDRISDVPMYKRLVARPLLRVGGRRFHKWFSPFYDWDSPPFFKSFLRIDVNGDASAGQARITCYAATGCGGRAESDPPVEDQFVLQWAQPETSRNEPADQTADSVC